MADKPERYSRKIARISRRRGYLLLLVTLGIALFMVALSVGSFILGLSGTLALSIALTLFIVAERIDRRASRAFESADKAERGAQAEELTEHVLGGLVPQEYFTFHNVPTPLGDLDHVVITRKGGVFAIETKSHSGRIDVAEGRVLVDGNLPDRDYVQQALDNAVWLKDQIGALLGEKPYVTAVLHFPNAYVNVRESIRDVIVASGSFLPRVLTTLPRSTSQSEMLWTHRTEIRDKLVGPDRGAVA
jgi:hypothetical protein